MKISVAMRVKALSYQLFSVGVMTVVLSACSTPRQPAPVEDISIKRKSDNSIRQESSTAVGQAETTGPTYVVKKGDTLISVGLETGHDWRDLAQWNNLDNPNRIIVGQTLRLEPKDQGSGAVVVQPVNNQTVEVRPIDAAPAVKPASKEESSKTTTPTVSVPVELPWAWPSSGRVIEVFKEGKNKGIDMAAKEGDLVLASADGKIVYAGNSLRGYGNLIIIKHNPTFLSAYAHNKTLLVKEGELVKRAQKIAEAGSTDADKVKVHFEIRKQGQPVDPLKYLPTR